MKRMCVPPGDRGATEFCALERQATGRIAPIHMTSARAAERVVRPTASLRLRRAREGNAEKNRRSEWYVLPALASIVIFFPLTVSDVYD